MPTRRLNPFPAAWKCSLTQFSGIWDPSEGLLVWAFEFLDLDYASVTALWKCQKHIKCQVHKCDNDFNHGGLSVHRIYRERDGAPPLQEGLKESFNWEISYGEDRIKQKKVKVKGRWWSLAGAVLVLFGLNTALKTELSKKFPENKPEESSADMFGVITCENVVS